MPAGQVRSGSHGREVRRAGQIGAAPPLPGQPPVMGRNCLVSANWQKQTFKTGRFAKNSRTEYPYFRLVPSISYYFRFYDFMKGCHAGMRNPPRLMREGFSSVSYCCTFGTVRFPSICLLLPLNGHITRLWCNLASRAVLLLPSRAFSSLACSCPFRPFARESREFQRLCIEG